MDNSARVNSMLSIISHKCGVQGRPSSGAHFFVQSPPLARGKENFFPDCEACLLAAPRARAP